MGKKDAEGSKAGEVVVKEEARSLVLAERGIKTSRDFTEVFLAMIPDVLSERLTPRVSNGACNAGGKVLKMIELESKYGKNPKGYEVRKEMRF